METKVENGKHYMKVQGDWVEYHPREIKQKQLIPAIKKDLAVSIQVGDTTYKGTARLVQYPKKGIGYALKLDPSQEIYGGGNLFIR